MNHVMPALALFFVAAAIALLIVPSPDPLSYLFTLAQLFGLMLAAYFVGYARGRSQSSGKGVAVSPLT